MLTRPPSQNSVRPQWDRTDSHALLPTLTAWRYSKVAVQIYKHTHTNEATHINTDQTMKHLSLITCGVPRYKLKGNEKNIWMMYELGRESID